MLLARRPNIWFDISSLPAYWRTEDYPYPTARQYLRRAVEMVGAEKIMWGTDVPGLLTFATYHQLLGFVARHCDFLSQEDLEGIVGGNAWRVYGEG
jgi:predicted TIM-barrel fold metal-dependent hydrolase